MRIYLDTCALNRLSDDWQHLRVHDEAQAVVEILTLIREKRVTWVASAMLVAEVSRNPDLLRREETLWLVKEADALVDVAAEGIERRSNELARLG